MRKFSLVCFFNIIIFSTYGQLIFYQDVFRGGICIAGTSSADASGNVVLPVNMSSNAILKKVFCVSYAQIGADFDMKEFTFYVNGLELTLTAENDLTVVALNNLGPQGYKGHRTHVKDVTTFFENFTDNSINIEWPPVLNLPVNCPSCRFSSPLFIFLYEDINLELINVELMLNIQNNDNEMLIIPQNMNAANFNKDLGMGIHSDRLAGSGNDGYTFFINNSNVGTIRNDDTPTINSGVIGNYYYENGILTGLTDDTADQVIGGSDGLLKINSYCNNSISNLNIKVNYFFPTSTIHNFLIGLYLAYSTPCDTFSITHSPDTTICPNETVQLFASGGTPNSSNTGYQWLADGSASKASELLSCTTCPNPVFIGDRSTLLTVQIWNNDSCSVVRPIKVNVRPKPSLNSIVLTPTDCGTNNGKATVTPVITNINTYTLDGQTPQFSSTFLDLSKGQHILHMEDAFGCVADTFFTINEVMKTEAKYYPSPGFGYLPLEVDFLNQSTQATDYDWRINDTYIDELNTYIFDSSGTYEVTLYAWQFDESCVDSFTLKIMVYDNFSFAVPNIFTPNEDAKNDVFGITTSNEVEVGYEIYNRWGGLVARGTVSGKGFVPIWDGSTFPPLEGDKGGGQTNSKGGSQFVSEGTYFYKLSLSLKEELFLPEETQNGIIDQTDFPIKAEGWVQVVR